jgi:hypothetical protein
VQTRVSQSYPFEAGNFTSDADPNRVNLWGSIDLIAQENGVALPNSGHSVVLFDDVVCSRFIRPREVGRHVMRRFKRL